MTSDSSKVSEGVPKTQFSFVDLFLPSNYGSSQTINLDTRYALSVGGLLQSDSLSMYEYDGSGTTVNDCAATVTWFVYKPIFYISPATLTLFTNHMKDAQFKADFSAAGTNNRAV